MNDHAPPPTGFYSGYDVPARPKVEGIISDLRTAGLSGAGLSPLACLRLADLLEKIRLSKAGLAT